MFLNHSKKLGISYVRGSIEVSNMKNYYSTVTDPKLFRRELLIPLGIIVPLFAFAFLVADDKTVTLFHLLLAVFLYCGIVCIMILRYGKAYRRVRIDSTGLHTRRCSISWEEIETSRLEDVTIRYNIFWRSTSSVVGINCGERDHFRSHTRNCLFFPLNHKTLTAIQFYSQGRSGAMTDLTEKYLSVVGK